MIDSSLLQILGCPLEESRPPLREENGYLVCTSCGCGFEIKDGIPNLLPDDAVPADKMKEILGAR